MNLVYIV